MRVVKIDQYLGIAIRQEPIDGMRGLGAFEIYERLDEFI